MDIKITVVNREIVEAALKQAKEGRMYIMGKMMEAINKHNEDLSPSGAVEQPQYDRLPALSNLLPRQTTFRMFP